MHELVKSIKGGARVGHPLDGQAWPRLWGWVPWGILSVGRGYLLSEEREGTLSYENCCALHIGVRSGRTASMMAVCALQAHPVSEKKVVPGTQHEGLLAGSPCHECHILFPSGGLGRGVVSDTLTPVVCGAHVSNQ